MEELQIKSFIVGSSLAVTGIPALLMHSLFKEVKHRHIFLILSLICGISNSVLVNHVLNEHRQSDKLPTKSELYTILAIFGVILGTVFSVVFGSLYGTEKHEALTVILWGTIFAFIFIVVVNYLNDNVFDLY